MDVEDVVIERKMLREQAYEAIRSLVVSGKLTPGEKVIVRVLSERLGLSATPIKSALASLERDGFLVSVAHRGYFVPEVDAQDMHEIYELREVLDGIAARKAAGLPDPAEFVASTLKPLHEQLQASLQPDSALVYSDIDIQFHQAIWHAVGNSRLALFSDNLAGQVRFGSGSSSRTPGRPSSALREHAAIMAAISKGDSARAEREAREHVRLSAVAFAKSSPHNRPGPGHGGGTEAPLS